MVGQRKQAEVDCPVRPAGGDFRLLGLLVR
jgi:hypothetical protein